MRVRSDHVRVNECWTLSLPGVVDGALEHVVAGEEITPVDFLDVEVREGANQLRDTSTGSVDLDRHRDGVAVVFDEVDGGQLEIARGIQRFPKLSFAGLAFARGDENDLVRLEALGDVEKPRTMARFSRSDALKELGPGRRRRRYDVIRFVPPVARHLSAA